MKRRRSGKAKQFLADALSYESDACLLWPYSVTGDRSKTGRDGGYGQLKDEDDRKVLAHNVICEQVHGPRPSPRHHAAHRCGTQLCINKRHVYWATPEQNSQDKATHGRVGRMPGELAPWALLTNKQVREIKKALAAGGPHGFQSALGRRYGASKTTISNIKHGRSWRLIT